MENQPTKTITPNLYKTYISLIRNSVGTQMFRNNYTFIDSIETDITDNGRLSCAFFASSVLAIVRLIAQVHVTVDGTVRDLQASGWQEIGEPREGCVIVWSAINDQKQELHKHIGFYIGNDTAISNSSEQGTPVEHHWTYGTTDEGQPTRPIEKLLWHAKLA